MKIKNLNACTLEENGTLEAYDKKNLLTIKKGVYTIGNSPVQYKIESTDRVQYTDYLKSKFSYNLVYQLRKADNNNEEIYISLTFCQNVKFILMNRLSIKGFFKVLVKPIEWLIKLLK